MVSLRLPLKSSLLRRSNKEAPNAQAGRSDPRLPPQQQQSRHQTSLRDYLRFQAHNTLHRPVRYSSVPYLRVGEADSFPDISVSSFFSLHRPLALKHAIPPVSSAETFSSIFNSQKQRNPWENGNSAEGRPENAIYAPRSLVESLANAANESHDDGVRWEIMHESSSNQDDIKHLDGPPRTRSMDELVAEFKPFTAPPPPEPFPDEPKSASKKKASKAKSKSYETTIIVTEFTSANGQRTYTASSSPIVRIPSPEDHPSIVELSPEGVLGRSSFKERRQERERAFWLRIKERMQDMPQQKLKMFLISVKRQRKLKMKKHKYKKLMKRTRNLRRRQERA